MFTQAQLSRSGRFVRVAAALALTSAVVSIAPARPADPGSAEEHEEHEGRAPTTQELQPAVEAAFQEESYAPGSVASLVLFNRWLGRSHSRSSTSARSAW